MRLHLTDRTKITVWAAAAGRCTLCNRLVLENDDLGLVVPIGELAHIVGWGEDSPRGESALSDEERRAPENLLLLCRTCHKPIDDGGVSGHYTVEELAKFKRDHEQRIRLLTDIGADRTATLLRVVGPIRGVNPELTYDTVLGAATAAGYFPTLLPSSTRAEYELDLRHLADSATPDHFRACAAQVDALVQRIDTGIRLGDVMRLAVFALARIPVLIHLGARLDDKVPTLVFQRHRTDTANPWRWPEDPPAAPAFATTLVRRGTDPRAVALTVNLSGVIGPEELEASTTPAHAIYSLAPVAPLEPSPTLISSPVTLTSFDGAVRRFLVQVERDHGKPERIDLFTAIPLSAAITLGRVLMPNVSPAWAVFDRDEQGHFFKALEVKR